MQYTQQEKQENINKVVKALRSGKYKQCRFALRQTRKRFWFFTEVEYCALGLIGEVLGRGRHGRQAAIDLGLDDQVIYLDNDGNNLSFKQIADKIVDGSYNLPQPQLLTEATDTQ